MDERLEKALNAANFMATFNNQREILKQEYEEKLLYHYNGFRFTVNKELINFIFNVSNLEIDEIVLIDDNSNPCLVEKTKKFKEDIFDIYFKASNEYYQKFLELKKKRSVFKLTLE
jgi:hypothetical protein